MLMSSLRFYICVFFLLCLGTAHAEKGVKVVFPDWFKPSLFDLQGDLQDARESGKRGILLFFSEKSCSYCNAIITTTFKQPDIEKRIRANYDTIGIEVFSDIELVDTRGKTHWSKDFAVQEKASFTPTMIFYDTSGTRQLRLVGYQSPDKFRGVLDYLEGGHEKKQSLRHFLRQRDNKSSNIGSAATPANSDFSRLKDKPLLAIFESNNCQKCQQLRSMLKAPVIHSYSERLTIAFINSDDSTARIVTPASQNLSPRDWANQLGLIHSPALVFFDEQGKEAVRVDTDILVDKNGKDVSDDDAHIIDNLRARLQFFLDKGYQTLPQFQRWRAQQKREKKT